MFQNVGSFPLLYKGFLTFKHHHSQKTSIIPSLPQCKILSRVHTQYTHPQEREKMNIMKAKFLKAWMKKWQRTGRRVIPSAACDMCCTWSLWPLLHEEKIVPSDVPKGHLVVYVGEYHKRFVIKVTLLKHPLFQALLDQAQEVYDFTADSRLRIPCDENIFLSIVQCAKSPPDRRLSICL